MMVAVTNHASHAHRVHHKVNNAKPTTHTWVSHALIKPASRKVPQNQPHRLVPARSAQVSRHVRRMLLLVVRKATARRQADSATANRNTKLYLNCGAILIGSAIVISQFFSPA
jgi:hypothetical protein